MLRFRSELGLDHRAMGTIRMGTIPTAITGHIHTIIGLTIGTAGIGTTGTTTTTAATGVITTILNVA
jgi:hypothetical protein